MPIPIECIHCGGKFAGKESLAGRRIRCPKCKDVFRVPAIEGAAAVAGTAKKSAGAKPAKTPPAEEEFDEWNLPPDFEYKVTVEDEGREAHCPFCRHEMKPDDVLCLNCGFNRQTGEKMATKTGDEAIFADEKKATPGHVTFGGLSLPLPVLLGVGGGLLAFAVVMWIFAPVLLAFILLGVGFLSITVGHFWVIILAFREDAFQGMLAWFVPIYWWVYAVSRFDAVALPFVITVAGWLMIFFGMGIVFLTRPPADPAELDQVTRSYLAFALTKIQA